MIKINKKDINLYDTIFSGQTFRMTLENDNSITIVLFDRVVNIKEVGNYLIIDSNKMLNLKSFITEYLDLNRNYNEINKYIISIDDNLKKEIKKCEGYKILKQNKFEMYITYIISQNNNVKRITRIVNKMSQKYGEKVIFRNKEYYLFPTYENLKDLTKEDFRNLGLGFRDEYLVNALNKIKENNKFLDDLNKLSTESAIRELMSIKGIGLKVASCIMLFGYSRLDTFPIDTWVRKYVSKNYNINDDIKVISKYMKNKYNQYSGLVIQYFYHTERNKKD